MEAHCDAVPGCCDLLVELGIKLSVTARHGPTCSGQGLRGCATVHRACFSLLVIRSGTFVEPDTFVARPNERVNLQCFSKRVSL